MAGLGFDERGEDDDSFEDHIPDVYEDEIDRGAVRAAIVSLCAA